MSQPESAPTATIPGEWEHPIAPPARRPRGLLARTGAELFGSFVMVFVGLGTALYASMTGAGAVGVALAWGIGFMLAVAVTARVSGGYANPAITLGMTVAGRLSWKDLVPYWVAQVAGATAAAGVLFTTIPQALLGDATAPPTAKSFFSLIANGFGEHSGAFTTALQTLYTQYLPQGVTTDLINQALADGQLSPLPAFALPAVLLVEAIASALLVAAVLAVTSRRRAQTAPLVLGLGLSALLLVTAPFSGGSLNPARSFAAAVFSDGWAFGQLWLFWVAPLVGALFAALVYQLVTTAVPRTADVPLDDELT
ncbi:MAG: MIP/aquaporin family protein, partial [Cellulomonadaceae bacterium]